MAELPDGRCDECNEFVTADESIVHRSMGHIPGEKGVVEVGILCPHCNHFHFAGFMDAPLIRWRTRLDAMKSKVNPEDQGTYMKYITGRIRYKNRFDSLNRRMCKRFKREIPGEQKWRSQQIMQKYQ